MRTLVALIAALFIASTLAAPACQQVAGRSGYWINVGGALYPCATTTRYWDNFKGACGCGTGTGNGLPYSWQYQIITAAASNSMFGDGTWCGSGCGKCFAITPTGGFVDGQGSRPSNLQSQVMMITNLCPAQYNQQWCTSPNQYGYTAHFDLMDQNMNGIISRLGWNNVEVYYQQIACPATQLANWRQCQCSK